MNRLKRLAVCFLAVTLFMSQSSWIFAAQSGAKETTAGNSAEAIGRVNLQIAPALILQKDVEFTVDLTGQTAQKITLAADLSQQTDKTEACFKNLADGDYTLTVNAPGFQTIRSKRP